VIKSPAGQLLARRHFSDTPCRSLRIDAFQLRWLVVAEKAAVCAQLFGTVQTAEISSCKIDTCENRFGPVGRFRTYAPAGGDHVRAAIA
jgi:hypothetical protein